MSERAGAGVHMRRSSFKAKAKVAEETVVEEKEVPLSSSGLGPMRFFEAEL